MCLLHSSNSLFIQLKKNDLSTLFMLEHLIHSYMGMFKVEAISLSDDKLQIIRFYRNYGFYNAVLPSLL